MIKFGLSDPTLVKQSVVIVGIGSIRQVDVVGLSKLHGARAAFELDLFFGR